MMMMQQQKPAMDVPPWSAGIHRGQHIPVSGVSSAGNLLLTEAALAALEQYFPLTLTDEFDEEECMEEEEMMESAAAVDAYSCDEFRMYEFKIRRCVRGRSHDWTECPYAHPGEKARRRDPRKYHYSGTACPDFRKGNCKRGDACEYAHGVFECWLHPARYRTQPCKDGTSCRRRVCFFAHTPDQLRVLPQSPKAMESYDGSPLRQQQQQFMTPPMSPTGESTMGDVIASMRKLQVGKVKSMTSAGSPTWIGFARNVGGGGGFCSLPTTPTKSGSNGNSRFGVGRSNGLGLEEDEEVEVAEERRVESGRALRAKLYEKLSKDAMVGPDFGWVSELVK